MRSISLVPEKNLDFPLTFLGLEDGRRYWGAAVNRGVVLGGTTVENFNQKGLSVLQSPHCRCWRLLVSLRGRWPDLRRSWR